MDYNEVMNFLLNDFRYNDDLDNMFWIKEKDQIMMEDKVYKQALIVIKSMYREDIFKKE